MEALDARSRRRVAVDAGAGVVLILLAVGLGVWIASRGDQPFGVDVWWNALVGDVVSPVLSGVALALNVVGAGLVGVLVVPLGGALVLVALRRPWAGACFLVAQIVSAALVQVLKNVFGRGRPVDILVVSDFGSYPSGHVAAAATLAAAAVVLFPRIVVVVLGALWVVLMALSRTYLHAHWLSDTLGGALVGVGAVLVVAAAFAVPLTREAPPRRTREETPSPA